MVTDWYNKTVDTPSEASPLPYLYHNYTGHDNNRDMYLFTRRRASMAAAGPVARMVPLHLARRAPAGHQSGPRIFTMPATDPINPNVDPLIYRLNGVFGQSQAAALEAEGKTGIIFNSTYTNFWQGAMAWAGWWHNQVGLLTEVASVRIATPTVQQMADPSRAAGQRRAGQRRTRRRHRSRRRSHRLRSRAPPRRSSSPTIPLPAPARHHPAHRISPSLAGRHSGPCATSWTTN